MTVVSSRQLDDRRVAQFAAVVEAGSVRGGAETLDIDPSVVSRSIARLEEDWGLVLLERRGRGVAITEAGRLVYDYYERHQRLRRDLIAQTEAMASLHGGHVDVICGTGYLKLISLAVNRFAEAYPGVTLTVVSDSSSGAYKRVLNDEFMVGLLFCNATDANIFRHYSLVEPICAVVRIGHPLARLSREIQLADLLEYPGYLPTPCHSIRQIIAAAELHDGIDLNVSVNSSCLDIVLGALAKSNGYTLLPPRGVQAYVNSGDVLVLPISNPIFRQSENCIISRRGRMLPPAAREFTKHLISIYSQYDGDLLPDVTRPTLYAASPGRPVAAKGA